jgi:hypothetical protein
MNLYRNLSPYSGLGRRSLLVGAKNTLGMHDQDPVGGQAVDFMFRTFPPGGIVIKLFSPLTMMSPIKLERFQLDVLLADKVRSLP